MTLACSSNTVDRDSVVSVPDPGSGARTLLSQRERVGGRETEGGAGRVALETGGRPRMGARVGECSGGGHAGKRAGNLDQPLPKSVCPAVHWILAARFTLWMRPARPCVPSSGAFPDNGLRRDAAGVNHG